MTDERRKLDRSELRLMLFAADTNGEGTPQATAFLHVIRLPLRGESIPACAPAKWRLAAGEGYWLFPFLNWLYQWCPVCEHCAEVMAVEGYEKVKGVNR